MAASGRLSLTESDKDNILSKLIREISHEFGNKLSIVMGTIETELLNNQSPQSKKRLQRVCKAVEEQAQLVGCLKAVTQLLQGHGLEPALTEDEKKRIAHLCKSVASFVRLRGQPAESHFLP